MCERAVLHHSCGPGDSVRAAIRLFDDVAVARLLLQTIQVALNFRQVAAHLIEKTLEDSEFVEVIRHASRTTHHARAALGAQVSLARIASIASIEVREGRIAIWTLIELLVGV